VNVHPLFIETTSFEKEITPKPISCILYSGTKPKKIVTVFTKQKLIKVKIYDAKKIVEQFSIIRRDEPKKL